MRYLASVLFSLVALAVCAPAIAHAEGVQEQKIYETFMVDGVLHRLDLRNGKMHRLHKLPNSAFQWVSVEVIDAGAPAASSNNPAPNSNEPSIPPPPKESGSAAIGEKGPKGRGVAPVIEEDDTGSKPSSSVVPPPQSDQITDDMRRDCVPLIASYENKVMPSHTIQIGEKIKGNILMKNTGNRRLKTLELTMSVNVQGHEKPEEIHFLFANKAGAGQLPQPGANGRDAAPVLFRVDMPCPSGEVRGTPEVRITYIQFE